MLRLPHFLNRLLCACALVFAASANAQNDIENVIVETYYISDAQDATDTIGGTLAQGSRTHRVYLDLCADCALRAIYGDANHGLLISSTTPFFNNLDRGKTYGHEINNSALDENTVALDSWFSLGAASNQKFGILKEHDPDGSILGGDDNDGGSAEVEGGLLINNDPAAGIPLTEQDGLIPLDGGTALPPNFNVQGIDPEVFLGDTTVSGFFLSYDTRVGCITPGVRGHDAENRILIAQLTTTGELTFRLNVEIEHPDGTVIHYVSSDSVLVAGETPNGLLSYPPQCGCTDPNFLEYDPSAGCDDGSCATTIVFGCLDPNACNYDTDANFNVPQLCCYGPDSCNGLDPALICPGVGVDELPEQFGLTVHPNPTDGPLLIRAPYASANVTVHDLAGRVVFAPHALVRSNDGQLFLDISGLVSGTYLLLVEHDGRRHVVPVIKN